MTIQGLDSRPTFTSIFCVDGKQQCRAQRWASSLPERKDPLHIHTGLSSAESTVNRLLQQVSDLPGNIIQVSPPSPLTQLTKDDVQLSCIVEGTQPAMDKESLADRDLTNPMMDGMHVPQMIEATFTAKKKVPVLPLTDLTRPENDEQVHGVSQQNPSSRDDGSTLSFAFWPTQLTDNEIQACQKYQNKPTATAISMVAHVDAQMVVLHWQVAAHVAQIWESFSCFAEVEKALLAAMDGCPPLEVAAHVAQIWESFSCFAEVEKALLAAMPESYEE
eukprot:CAMPEP_0172933314 /NCGR_PEP_ID=MMETSP1075-20121228/220443_1 /TAXON_ID=2916 /ORGANISM="Ceratium fusus, Strain PA161109" /LENGTH=275 /DNA_ID=CAMNT_0013794655 /DNA_START=592 /DNA_END=1420 /DNA_ORIENTATION=+